MRGCNFIAISASEIDLNHPTGVLRLKNLSENFPSKDANHFGSAEEQPKTEETDWVTLRQAVMKRGLPLFRSLVIELTQGTPEHNLLERYKRENSFVGLETHDGEIVTQYRADLVTFAEIFGEIMDQEIIYGDEEHAADLLLHEFEKVTRCYGLYPEHSRQDQWEKVHGTECPYDRQTANYFAQIS